MPSTSPFTLRSAKTAGSPAASPAFARWVETHWPQLLLAGGMALLAGLLAVAIVISRQRLAERASDQLTTAQNLMMAGKNKESLENVDRILREQKTGTLTFQARLLKGDILLRENNPQGAVDAYREVYDQTDLPAYKSLALGNRAAALEEMQKWPEAAAAYHQFIKDYPEHFLIPRAYLGAARMEMAQFHWKEAQDLLEHFITIFPKSVWVAPAKELLGHVRQAAAAQPPKAK